MKTNPNDLVYPVSESDSHVGGLTKREYFAAMAMQGIMSLPLQIDIPLETEAAYCVAMSDALINALNETK